MSSAEAPSTRARFICRDSGDTIRGQRGCVPSKFLSCCRKHSATLCQGEGSQGTQEGSEATRDPLATKHRPGSPRFGQKTPQVTPLRVCDLQTPWQPSGQAGDRARQRGQGQAEGHLGDNGSGEGFLLGAPGTLSWLLGTHRHHPDPAVSSAQLWFHIIHLGTQQGEGELGWTPRFRIPPKALPCPQGSWGTRHCVGTGIAATVTQGTWPGPHCPFAPTCPSSLLLATLEQWATCPGQFPSVSELLTNPPVPPRTLQLPLLSSLIPLPAPRDPPQHRLAHSDCPATPASLPHCPLPCQCPLVPSCLPFPIASLSSLSPTQ